MATDSKNLDSSYDPTQIEKAIYAEWEKKGLFTPKADGNHKDTYTIILPPPNVTGVLHMGHALTVTIEDLLIRRQRMEGKKALWVPGTDHAGIATQMVVERKLLKEEKKSRHDLGREKFLEKVWEWKEQSQGTILHQLRLMGCALDWSRLAFTLDENVSAAVRECFKRLFDEGLIYREMAITQWCPRCHTALSDLEVKAKETKGKFWHIKYRLASDKSVFLVVATTRPETLLGDTAVAIHPEDDRFKAFRGKKVIVPLVNREVPVIQDAYVDKEFGTGALKITPSHDANDYVIGKKHNLPMINIFDESAILNKEAGVYAGLNREKAREKVLADLVEQELLIKEEDHLHNVGHCDRCGTMVEPRVSNQWFVKAEELAKDAIRVVESGEIKIVPKEWEKTYFEWMRNIRPWCISRQLWWGHRIPVWYCLDCNDMQAASSEKPLPCKKCKSTNLKQDDDVLDTWFSSGLWPISTLGWPKDTADLKTFYPTSVMETGFDILFFWVARMIMMCMKMTGKIPFHTVYLHPMVRDEHGQKMSKTKGNVVDPLEIAEKKGADALRFFLTWNAYHGRDLRVSDDGVEGCRNFANKVWNASRFVLMHFGDLKDKTPDTKNPINGWIVTRLNQTKRELNAALDEYRFFEAAQIIYHFFWNDYCDRFIELMKPDLESRKKNLDSTALEVLEESVRLLHPFMPFLTERIWQALPIREKGDSISFAKYPKPDAKEDTKAFESVSELIDITDKLRNKRGVYEIPVTKELNMTLVPLSADAPTSIYDFLPMVKHLAKTNLSIAKTDPPKGTTLPFFTKNFKVHMDKNDLPDLEKEIAKQKKELEDKKGALSRAEDKLKNEKFMNSAPQNVRDGVVKTRDDLVKSIAAIEQYLKDVTS